MGASKMLWSTGIAYLVADCWIIWVEKWLVVSAMGHGTWDTIYVDDSMLRSWKSCSRNVCKTHIESLSWFLFYFGREGGLEFKILRNYYFCKEYPYVIAFQSRSVITSISFVLIDITILKLIFFFCFFRKILIIY